MSKANKSLRMPQHVYNKIHKEFEFQVTELQMLCNWQVRLSHLLIMISSARFTERTAVELHVNES